MDIRKWTILLSVAIVVVLVVGILLGVTHFDFIGGHFYPQNAQLLDLREKDYTPEQIDAIQDRLPQSFLLWEIPFQGGKLSSDARELTVTSLTDQDVARLDYALVLEQVDGTGCTDYAQLVALQKRHPHTKVLYQMTISGVPCDQDTESLKLKGLTEEDAVFLTYLPKLSQLEISGCEDYALLMELQSSYPQWNLQYTVALGKGTYDWDAKTIQAEQAKEDQLVRAMTGLPKLETLNLTNPQAEGPALMALREQYPQVDIHWQIELYGQTVTDEITELDISGSEIKSCEEVEQAVACLPNLERLVLGSCGLENEDLAAFRERQRENYKVVWTITLAERAALKDRQYIQSDATTLWSNCYYRDEEVVNLKYCEDMVCLDLGHTGVINVDFLAYMPHLKYLILAHSGIQYIEPIVNCQELVYLEVDWSTIRDYTPIAELKNLEDLNLNETGCKITPILSMTWLKNLWAPGRAYSDQLLLIEALPDTNLHFYKDDAPGEGWRNLQNYYDMRDMLGQPYMS